MHRSPSATPTLTSDCSEYLRRKKKPLCFNCVLDLGSDLWNVVWMNYELGVLVRIYSISSLVGVYAVPNCSIISGNGAALQGNGCCEKSWQFFIWLGWLNYVFILVNHPSIQSFILEVTKLETNDLEMKNTVILTAFSLRLSQG